MCSDPVATARGCAFFSATGILFMIWVGVMIMTQPFYMGGLENVDQAKGNAFGAATAFFFTFVVSILYVIRDARTMTIYGGSSVVSGGSGSNGSGGGGGGLSNLPIPRQLENPFSSATRGGSLFHDYDQVATGDADAEEFERGVFT